MIGCIRKTARLLHPSSKRTLILALDHGTVHGPLPGLENMAPIIEGLAERDIQGLLLNKGFVRLLGLELPLHVNIITQLSAGTRHALPPYNRALAGSVPDALREGADALAVQLNLGNEFEDRMIADTGLVTEEAHRLGAPVLAMIRPKGEHIVNELDPALVAHSVRLGAELGLDLVGVPYPQDGLGFEMAVATCPIPVIVAGGARKARFEEYLQQLEQALNKGAAGAIVGRNVFQHDDPLKRLDEIIDLVHGPDQ